MQYIAILCRGQHKECAMERLGIAEFEEVDDGYTYTYISPSDITSMSCHFMYEIIACAVTQQGCEVHPAAWSHSNYCRRGMLR